MSRSLDAGRLRQALDYDPATGIFRWRESRGNQLAGAVAGGLGTRGYWRIGLDGVRWTGHVLAWLYVHGVLPRVDLDHINQVKSDNRISNLREDVAGLNRQNRDSPRSDNSSGFLGVCWDKRESKWLAQISVNGRRKHLGYHATPEAASEAYLAAKRELHPFWEEGARP